MILYVYEKFQLRTFSIMQKFYHAMFLYDKSRNTGLAEARLIWLIQQSVYLKNPWLNQMFAKQSISGADVGRKVHYRKESFGLLKK